MKRQAEQVERAEQAERAQALIVPPAKKQKIQQVQYYAAIPQLMEYLSRFNRPYEQMIRILRQYGVSSPSPLAITADSRRNKPANEAIQRIINALRRSYVNILA